MSIASQITTMQEHIEDIYDTFAVAGVDTSAAAKNIVNINANLKERLEYYLANGLDVVWDNWNKVSGSGTTLSLNNTIQAKMDFVYKGNTSQSILPSGYTQVDYITSDGNSYIDTGKTLGDNFKIETKFIHNQQSSNEQPIISTWVQSFQWFNLYIASNNQLRFYATGNNMTSNPTLTIGNINTVSYSRNSNEWVGTLNGETVTFNTNISADNPTTFKILSRGDVTLGSYVSIYRLKLFENNILTMDLIPCYRNSDNVIGMYDIVNNIFYINSGTGNFTYGSVAPNPDCPIPVNVVTGDNEVKVEGKNLLDTSYLVEANANKTYSGYGYWAFKLTNELGTFTLSRENNTMYSDGGYLAIGQGQDLATANNNKVWLMHPSVQGLNVQSRTLTNTGELWLITNSNQANINNMLTRAGYLQLEKNSTATSYEEHKEQTYPINLGSMELCKIGDYQDVIKRSSGKNLLDENYYNNSSLFNVTTNYFIFAKLPDTFKTKFYVNMSLKGTNQNLVFGFTDNVSGVLSGGIRVLDNGTINSNVECDFTNAENVYLAVGNSQTVNAERDVPKIFDNYNIMVSTTSGEQYEPYGKVWYKYGAIGKVVLDGSENWTYYQHYLQMSLTGGIDWVGSVAPQGLCNKYICRARYFIINTTYKKDKSISLGSSFLALYDSNFTDVTSFKTWLSTYNTTVYYALLTPTITPITDTTLLNQLEAIKLSYNEQTNISQTNTDKPFILDVTALKDLDVEDTTPTLTTNQGLLFTQPPVSENSINDEDDNSILEETINEEEPNIEDDNREEEEPGDFFEKEIINNDEEQEEIPPEPIEIDNGQR